jgi:hypothetical protein
MTQGQYTQRVDATLVCTKARSLVTLPAPRRRPALCARNAWSAELCPSAPPSLTELTLAFDVSSDDEFVHLRLLADRAAIDMGACRHNYLLLTLARRRARDLRDGMSEGNAGWVDRGEWAHDETFQPPGLNLYVHRARKRLAARGIRGAYGIVERRGGDGQIRLGPLQVRINRL